MLSPRRWVFPQYGAEILGKSKRDIRGRQGAERAAQLKGVDLERVMVSRRHTAPP
ncbi:MAG: hypothetical protein AB1445_09025 [Bacillota bacterium]